MKKTLSFVLALVLALAVAVPAFAAEGTPSSVNTPGGTDVHVTYDYSESYMVTIPADFNTNPDNEGSVQVTAKGRLSYGKTLNVVVASAHEDASSHVWNLANEQDQKVTYYLSKTPGGSPALTNANNSILSLNATELPALESESPYAVNLYHKITGTVQYAGVYQDTLTFTVSVS